MRRAGFTLMELVVVLVVLAIVMAVAIPRLSYSIMSARLTATRSDLLAADRAILLYREENGQWPSDRVPAVFPPELTGYLEPDLFAKPAPIGGAYDWNNGWGPFPVGMSVHDGEAPLARWEAFDARYDDGDLTAGDARRHGANICTRLE